MTFALEFEFFEVEGTCKQPVRDVFNGPGKLLIRLQALSNFFLQGAELQCLVKRWWSAPQIRIDSHITSRILSRPMLCDDIAVEFVPGFLRV